MNMTMMLVVESMPCVCMCVNSGDAVIQLIVPLLRWPCGRRCPVEWVPS